LGEVPLLMRSRWPKLLYILCLSAVASLPCQAAVQAQEDPSENSHTQTALKRARQLLTEGRFNDALSQLTQIEQKNPGLKGLNHEFGVAYYRANDFPSAAGRLQQAVKEGPENKEAVQLLGLAYYFLGKPGEAIPLLEKVSSWMPAANVDAHYVLGLAYIQTKDYDQARRSFARMHGIALDSAAAHLLLARMLVRQGHHPIAEEQAKQAIAKDPKLPMAHYLLGELYTFKSRIPEAIAQFERELEINPANAVVLWGLAEAYVKVTRLDEAQRLLQRAMFLDPSMSGPQVLMGKVLLRKGEPQLAMRALQQALSTDPQNHTAHHLLGQAYRALGQKEQAEREFKLAEELQAAKTRGPAEQPN
jgi:tetratricopeptide (TPR) repeat protein